MRVFHGPKGVSNRLKNDRNRKSKGDKDLKKFSLQSLNKKDRDNQNASYAKRFFKVDDSEVFSRVSTKELLNRRKMEKSYIDQINFNTRRAKFDDLLERYRNNRNMAIEIVEDRIGKDFDLKHMIYIENYQLLDNAKANRTGNMLSYYI